MTERVLYEAKNGVATITLNQPEVLNALDEAVVEELLLVVQQLERDPTVGVCILTGAGKAFCTGGNLAHFADQGNGLSHRDPLAIRDYFRKKAHRLFLALDEIDVPLIAAVNGPAHGAGFGLACLCDMRIASKKAVFCESFVKLGLVPADGDAWTIPRIIGLARYAELLFTARPVKAAEALKMGIVSQVVEHQKLPEAAMALARSIAVHPSAALRMAKRLYKEAQRTDLRANLETAASMMAILHRSEAHHAALAKFQAKGGKPRKSRSSG